ncbi:hypothetical protein IFM46972_04710 [Aspergillus udagawae]|uniref:Uncharacterized protein n=1 Tax=Aspergillus udagawae TaxID=91492 RepID=A0A8H3RXQ9_9EURO|nr:hypothetical protein IFM46972_04710 [Aspergillus udagawae]
MPTQSKPRDPVAHNWRDAWASVASPVGGKDPPNSNPVRLENHLLAKENSKIQVSHRPKINDVIVASASCGSGSQQTTLR